MFYYGLNYSLYEPSTHITQFNFAWFVILELTLTQPSTKIAISISNIKWEFLGYVEMLKLQSFDGASSH